jgi:3-oxoacyl-(acyl-carrier-protein) synthase
MGGRAFITGKAMVCSLGDSLKEIVEEVRQKRIKLAQLPFTMAGLPYTRPYYLIMRNEADALDNRSDGYFYEILFSTVARALADAGVTGAEITEMPIFFGSTSMDVPVFEGSHLKSASTVSGLFLQSSDGYGKIAGAVGERFGMEAGCYSFTTACTSSANALLYATAMIKQRQIERALVVGYDLFNNLGFYGFEGLKSLAVSEYRPFDRTRDGLILGEACGAVILEGKRRQKKDFECLGGANLCDIYSVTSHDEEGAVVAETMNRALGQAGIESGDISAVKAHATGTENNDRTECAAMKSTFNHLIPPVTCIKPFIGHTAGACGVSELIVFTESVKTGFLPSTPGFRDMDEELNLKPLTENREAGEGCFMLNYFGFGGNCTTLILSNKNHTG